MEKEKAKAYDKALERAKKWLNAPNVDKMPTYVNRVIEEIFPELKESEDERIRKALIEYFTTSDNNSYYAVYGVATKKILAWLEKQGEHIEINPTEFDTRLQNLIGQFDSLSKDELIGSLTFWLNVVQNDGTYKEEKQGEQKPIIDGILTATNYDKMFQNCKIHKFNVGDWITNGDYTWKIVEVMPLDYILQSQDGNMVDDTISHVDEQFHSFTIEDAKVGDMLFCTGDIKNSNGIKYERICLFNNLDNAFFTLTKLSNFVEEYDIDVNIDYPNNTVPATKEQCDLLFQKMKEAGYEWDFEKKELRLLITNGSDFDSENCEQNPTDLEEFINELSKQFPDVSFAKLSRIAVRVKKWVEQKQKPTWSEEDEGYMDRILEALYDYYPKRYAQSIYDWFLNSLKKV